MAKQETKASPLAVAGGELTALAARQLVAGVPDAVVVLPWGEVESTSGAFTVDDESAAAIIEAFAAHGTDLPIDYEHQTLGGVYAAPEGKAPAAGWITRLRSEPGVGVVAEVNWTDEGRTLLAAKAYRYLSPVALIRKDDRKVVALHSVGLTNKPAIVGMAAVVNREGEESEVARESEALIALSAKLDLQDSASPATVLCAARERLEQLEAAAAARDAEALIEEALRAGKLTEAQREWALALALRDPDCYRAWAETAPVIAPTGRLAAPPATVVDEGLRTRAAQLEYRACRALHGITTEEAFVADALRQRLS